MDRSLEIRRPVPQKHHGLSTVSKIFFGVDIFQVVMVVTFQSVMIAYGNFNAFNSPENPGMGPGRRIYMCVYMGVVVYTCFLCLFAVKQQNILEIVAFLLQNFGFVTYGLIQVYHVGYKKLPVPASNASAQHNVILRNVALTNSLALFFLNGVFIFLSWKLYTEFGWKIYKRVRFNMSLRSSYHFYQLLSCLLKMEIMYWWMYSICNSFVLLRDTGTLMYYVNLTFIPLSVLYAGLGYIATQREIKILMCLFIMWTIGGAGYFVYKLYGFMSDTCNGCQEFHKTGKDIYDEAILHLVYLGSLNLILLLALLGVASKVFANFGKGLEEHFKPPKEGRPRAQTDLYLRRVSNYVEESVVSVTSYESAEYDELNESMRLGSHQLTSTSAVLLIENDEFSLSSSMPNLAEASNPKAKTLPLEKNRTLMETTLRTFDKHLPIKGKVLASIDEDDDLEVSNNRNGWRKPGDEDSCIREREQSKWKAKWDRSNGSKPNAEERSVDKKKENCEISMKKNELDNGKASNGLSDDFQRDSGCIDCHEDNQLAACGMKPLPNTRKHAITSDMRNDEAMSKNTVHGMNMSMPGPRPNGNVKSKINIFATKD